MATIFVKDALRASVEAASKGAQTVLYTPKGQPTFVNIIPKQNIQDLNPSLGISGVHPAFKVGDKEIPYLYIGTYQGCTKNGEILSLPRVDANTCNYNGTVNATALRGMGATWHIMSSVEWALMEAIAIKNGYIAQGANSVGWSNVDKTQYGIRVDGSAPGVTGMHPRILTGSGPVSFRNNVSYDGISDLVGNMWERTPGFRTVKGELQIYKSGNEIATADVGVCGAHYGTTTGLSGQDWGWRAIDATTGALLIPTFTGSTTESTYVPTTPNSIRAVPGGYTSLASNEIYQPNWNWSGTAPVNTLPAAVRKILDLYGIWPSETGSSLMIAGSTVAYFPSEANAKQVVRARSDLFQFGTAANNETTNTDMGVRPAYYTPLA